MRAIGRIAGMARSHSMARSYSIKYCYHSPLFLMPRLQIPP